MDRVAELVKKTRDETFRRAARERHARELHDRDLLVGRGHPRQRVEPHPAEAHARLGIVAIENQARI